MNSIDCIPYINDLAIEIQILNDVKAGNKCNNDEIDKQIFEKKLLIEKCKNNLSKLSDNQICYRIYLKFLNGNTISKSIEEVAEENYQKNIKPNSINGIWNYYNNTLKKIINK